MGHPGIRERQSKPEKRAGYGIKGIGSDEICAKVGAEMPAKLAVSYSLVAKLIKGYLLDVKVTKKYKIALIVYNVGYKKTGGTEKSRQKHGKGAPLLFS